MAPDAASPDAGGPGASQIALDPAEPAERARKLFSGPVAFVTSAPAVDLLPPPTLPEVALAGRSNVGKSSLLNALTGRNTLARTSNTPGRTQQLNVFDLADPPELRLVDLPGYGFANAPKAVARGWRMLVAHYLRSRLSLRRVLLLVDSRHGLKPNDLDAMALMDGAAISYQLVLTKADKLKPTELAAVEAAVTEQARTHPAAYPGLIATSAETGAGIEALRAAVLEAAL